MRNILCDFQHVGLKENFHPFSSLISLSFTSYLRPMYVICLLNLINSNNNLLQGQLRHDAHVTEAVFCGRLLWSVYLPRCSQLVTRKPRKGTLTPPGRGLWRCEKGNSIQLHNAARPIKEPRSPFCGDVEWTTEGSSNGSGAGFGLATPPPAAVLSVRPATLHS